MEHKLRLIILGLITTLLLGSLLLLNIGCGPAKSSGISNLPSKSVTVTQNPGADPEMKTKEAVKEQEAQVNNSEVKIEPVGQGKAAPAAPTVPAAKTERVVISAFSDGKLLFSITEMVINRDESVFSVTKRAAAQSSTALDCQGFGPAAYITGIGNLKEFDQGPMSGWLYKVNDKVPGVGCGLYKLKSGDKVEWVYTTDGKL